MLKDILGNDILHDIAELRSLWFHQEARGGTLTTEQKLCRQVITALWEGLKAQAEENERLLIFVREAEK